MVSFTDCSLICARKSSERTSKRLAIGSDAIGCSHKRVVRARLAKRWRQAALRAAGRADNGWRVTGAPGKGTP